MIVITNTERSFAGNPSFELSDRLRKAYSVLMSAYDYDAEKVLKGLHERSNGKLDSQFMKFLEEQNKKAKSVDGSARGKTAARNKNIDKMASEADFLDKKSEEVDVSEDLFGTDGMSEESSADAGTQHAARPNADTDEHTDGSQTTEGSNPSAPTTRIPLVSPDETKGFSWKNVQGSAEIYSSCLFPESELKRDAE